MSRIDNALTTGMKLTVVAIAAIGFCWLAEYSRDYGRQEHGSSGGSCR